MTIKEMMPLRATSPTSAFGAALWQLGSARRALRHGAR
jgi:hypothetical protein